MQVYYDYKPKMSVPVARSSHAIPPTQNTAPVHEFRVLYSHDLRRKQKRWQDGTLKYHTFNKRVMVYDTLKNFIGDTHWKETEEPQDGDEVDLEVGILVQVGECVGREETDLRGLFERPRKDAQDGERRKEVVIGSGRDLLRTARTTLGGNAVPLPRDYLRHKSLNSLLGTPKSALGKAALPTKSPYEVRNGTATEDGQAAKRQRTDEPRWNITRTTTPVKSSKSNESSPLVVRSDARNSPSARQPTMKAAPLATGQKRLGVKEVIDITSDKDENIASDITLPDTPPILPTATPALKPKRIPTIPRLLRERTPPVTTVIESRSPAVSTENRITNVEANVAPLNKDAEEEFQDIEKILPPKKNSQLKPLKLVKQKPRNKLLCVKTQPHCNVEDKLAGAKGSDVIEDEHPAPKEQAKKKNTTNVNWKSATKSKSRRDAEQPVVQHERSPSSSPAFSTMPQGKTIVSKTMKPRGMRRKEHDEKAMVRGTMDQRILPVRESPTKVSDTRAFHRVRSENDAIVSLPLDNLSSLPVEDECPAANVGKKPMRRSLSENDGTRKHQKAKAKAADGETRKKLEKGPWTAEALDFFDWRPPDWEERQRVRYLSPESSSPVQVAG